MSTTPSGVALEDIIALTKRLRLKYLRESAPEILITAKAQRWDPAEVVKALLVAEVAGRDRSGITNRTKRSRLRTGKTFDEWDEEVSRVPSPMVFGLKSLEWVTRGENLVICGPSGTGKSHFTEVLGHAAIEDGKSVIWFTVEDRGPSFVVIVLMVPMQRLWQHLHDSITSLSTTLGCLGSLLTPQRVSTASTIKPTNDVQSQSRPIFIHRPSTRSRTKTLLLRSPIDSYITHTSPSLMGPPSGSATQPRGRGQCHLHSDKYSLAGRERGRTEGIPVTAREP